MLLYRLICAWDSRDVSWIFNLPVAVQCCVSLYPIFRPIIPENVIHRASSYPEDNSTRIELNILHFVSTLFTYNWLWTFLRTAINFLLHSTRVELKFTLSHSPAFFYSSIFNSVQVQRFDKYLFYTYLRNHLTWISSNSKLESNSTSVVIQLESNWTEGILMCSSDQTVSVRSFCDLSLQLESSWLVR